MSSHPIADHSPTTPAALYSDKYAWLMRWALHFCNKDRSAAEDLVQDVFMQMLVSWPAFQTAQEPEKLLYTYLKYSFLLKCRKDRRYSFQTLSAIDFESLHLSLRRETFAHALDLQDGLRRIVNYLNWRKQQAKAASVLLLRFIHGYFPSEIMQIAILNRRSVDNGLAQAREESKSYLADPNKVQVIYRGAPPAILSSQSVLAPESFVIALRNAVFDSRYGECVPEAILHKRYLGPSPRAIECDLLAHIVSCRHCLNLVSRWCKLPSIENRIPEEAWGFAPKEKRPADSARTLTSLKRQFSKPASGTCSARNNEQALFSMHGGEQRFRVAHEHRPKALSIAVDGQMIAARDISSANSQLNIELTTSPPRELIEVISEQELPLLTVPVLFGPGEGPQCFECESVLANGQRVHLVVRFLARGVLLEVDYFDPFFVPEQVGTIAACEPAQAVIELTGLEECSSDHRKPTLPEKMEMPGPANKHAHSALRTVLLRLIGRCQRIRQLFSIQGGLATCVVAIGGIVFVRWISLPTLPAPQVLLQHAVERDTAGPSSPAGVILQKLRVQSRSGSGSINFYRQIPRDTRGKRLARLSPQTGKQQAVAAKLAAADINWDNPLSAANYGYWHNHANVTKDKVEQSADGNLVLTSYVNDGTLASESLTLRANDFHPIARTVDFRDRNEIEIAEVDYKVIPWSQADPRWFQAEGIRDSHPPVVSTHALTKKGATPPTPGQLDEAELGVRLGLSEVKADGGERLQVSRAADGIHVDALIAEDRRKREIVSRLSQVPHTVLNVRTFKEFEQQQADSDAETQPSSVSIAVAPQETGQSPLEHMLQQQGKPAEEAGKLAHAFFANSVMLQQSAAAVDDLDRRFRPSALTPDALLILKHLRAAQMNRIETAVADDNKLLSAVGVTIPVSSSAESLASNSSNESERRATLSSQAAIHAKLCTELVSQSMPSSRASHTILSDMVRSLISLENLAEQNGAEQAHGNMTSPLGTTAQQH